MPTQTFDGRFDAIRSLCNFLLQGAQQAGFSERELFQIELACDEACTNIIEHAYGGEDVGKIEASWALNDAAFTVTLRDTGEPFDPETIERPNLPDAATDFANLKIGGLGLHFMRTVMDELHYEFDAYNNTLVMRKNLPSDAILEPYGPIERQRLEDALVLRPTKRLDHATVSLLENALSDAVRAQIWWLLLDMSQTAYINSGGLRALVTAWRRVRAQNGDLILFGLDDKLLNVFQMVGFDQVFQIADDQSAAVNRMHELQRAAS